MTVSNTLDRRGAEQPFPSPERRATREDAPGQAQDFPFDPLALVEDDSLRQDVLRLSRVSSLRGLWAVLRQWLAMAGAAAVALCFSDSWAAWVLAGIVIATRQHALGILVHDATHFRILNQRRLNDWISDFFCAFPIGLTTNLYRRQHLAHHRHLNTDDDPYWHSMTRDEEWAWPKAQWETLKLFLFDLFGLHAGRIFRWSRPWSPWKNFLRPEDPDLALTRGEKLRFLLFLAGTGALLSFAGSWAFALLALWMVPALTLGTLMIRWRSSAEHLALPNTHVLNASRHVSGTWLDRLWICPLNINYHIDHHLYPSVPYYHLPGLHSRLMRLEPYRQHAHLTDNYTGLKSGLLAEIVKPARSGGGGGRGSEPNGG